LYKNVRVVSVTLKWGIRVMTDFDKLIKEDFFALIHDFHNYDKILRRVKCRSVYSYSNDR